MGALHSQDSRPDGPPDRRAAGRVGGDQARRERGGKGEERTEGEKKGEVGGGRGALEASDGVVGCVVGDRGCWSR